MLTATDIAQIRQQITETFERHASLSPTQITGILPIKDLQGKLYEAHVLSQVIKNLAQQEVATVVLKSNTGHLQLKQKGSPINRNFPYFEIFKKGKLWAELFTDTEFTAQSHSGSGRPISNGDYHELDIAMFSPGATGRPYHWKIMLAVECKATSIEKSTFRELLGFRRELAIICQYELDTKFAVWPTNKIIAAPPSVHMCYSTDPAILRYKENAKFYGILVVHEPMV